MPMIVNLCYSPVLQACSRRVRPGVPIAKTYAFVGGKSGSDPSRKEYTATAAASA